MVFNFTTSNTLFQSFIPTLLSFVLTSSNPFLSFLSLVNLCYCFLQCTGWDVEFDFSFPLLSSPYPFHPPVTSLFYNSFPLIAYPLPHRSSVYTLEYQIPHITSQSYVLTPFNEYFSVILSKRKSKLFWISL